MTYKRDAGSEKAELLEQKERVTADRYRIEADILSGALLPRNLFTHYFNRIYQAYRNQVFVLDLNLGDLLTAVLGLQADKSYIIREIIGKQAYGTVQLIWDEIEAYINSGEQK